MKTTARQKLINAIVDNSESTEWESAVQEWSMTACRIDSSCSSQCVCGQERIKYLFEITNFLNRNILFPIGSRCINKFGRKDLDEQVDVYEQMCRLLEAVKAGEYIALDSKLFSKKLIKYLYEHGVFQATSYNLNNSYNDYKFLIDMFGKRNPPTVHQQKKINALIIQNIIPYCRDNINSME